MTARARMGAHIPGLGLHHLVPPRTSVWIQFLLGTPVVFWGVAILRPRLAVRGEPQPQHVHPHRPRDRRRLPLQPGCDLRAWGIPRGVPRHGRHGGRYFEAAAVITVLVLLGQVLELRAREQTGGAIRALVNMAPKTARRIKASGQDEEIPLADVQVGDRLRVRPGESVPVDGEVLEGGGSVDESMVTQPPSAAQARDAKLP